MMYMKKWNFWNLYTTFLKSCGTLDGILDLLKTFNKIGFILRTSVNMFFFLKIHVLYFHWKL